jgi:hypothetical protein
MQCSSIPDWHCTDVITHSPYWRAAMAKKRKAKAKKAKKAKRKAKK